MGNLETRRKMSYSDKAAETENDAAKRLFTLMEEKESNLILANDDLEFENFLPLVEKSADEICMVKTHMDTLRYPRLSPGYKQEIIDTIRRDPEEAISLVNGLKPMEEHIEDTISGLSDLSRKYGFMIFEDRKYADIGKIVKEQGIGGAFRIMKWADFVNAHAISGPGIIDGLYEAAKAFIDAGDPRGLIMLAHMTPEKNLFTEKYAEDTIRMSEERPDFVVGYVAGGSHPDKLKDWVAAKASPASLIVAPGTKFDVKDRVLGQRYSTPDVVIGSGADALIVGSGIYKAKDPAAEAAKYRKTGWDTYRSVRGIG